MCPTGSDDEGEGRLGRQCCADGGYLAEIEAVCDENCDTSGRDCGGFRDECCL